MELPPTVYVQVQLKSNSCFTWQYNTLKGQVYSSTYMSSVIGLFKLKDYNNSRVAGLKKFQYRGPGQEPPGCNRNLVRCAPPLASCPCWTFWFSRPKERKAPAVDSSCSLRPTAKGTGGGEKRKMHRVFTGVLCT